LEDLKASVEFVLKENGVRARIRSAGGTLIVVGPEPIGVAALLENMPGVAWIAVGEAASSFRGLAEAGGALAKKYLRKGDRFRVEAEGSSGVVEGDVSGVVTSGVLDSVRGARVSQAHAKVTFRASFNGSKGTVGVELRLGPGGAPTGNEAAACLVSGGMHSSVLAWMAALAGFRVRLIHARASDEGLKAVARLYSELSHRVDPRGLSIEVLEGGGVSDMLAKFAAREGGQVFGGFGRTGREVPSGLRAHVLAPLYVMPEEWFRSEYESLGVKGHDSKADWSAKKSGAFVTRSFGAMASDISGVLDALR